MNTFTILNFYPSKTTGNMLGFAGLQFYLNIGGRAIPQSTKVKIMRNGNTGHIFFSYHSEKYKDTEGNDKYSDLIRCQTKEDMDFVQKEFTKAWQEYVQKNAPKANTDSTGQPNDAGVYYPHGLAKNNPPIQEQQQIQFSDNEVSF